MSVVCSSHSLERALAPSLLLRVLPPLYQELVCGLWYSLSGSGARAARSSYSVTCRDRCTGCDGPEGQLSCLDSLVGQWPHISSTLKSSVFFPLHYNATNPGENKKTTAPSPAVPCCSVLSFQFLKYHVNRSSEKELGSLQWYPLIHP